MIALEDLTKEELIALVKTKGMMFSKHDIARVRWYSLGNRAKALREQSIAVSQSINLENDKVAKAKKWSIADSFWKQAEKLQAEADNVLAEMSKVAE